MSKRKSSSVVDKANKRVRTAEQEEEQDTEEDAGSSEDHLPNEQVSGIAVHTLYISGSQQHRVCGDM